MQELIKNQLLKSRPNLSLASLKTYGSLLNGLLTKMSDRNDKNNSNLKFFKDNELNIIKHVNSLVNDTSKKTILAAYFILTGSDKAHKLMMDIARSVNQEISNNKKSEKQDENWLTQKEVTNLLNEYKLKSFNIMNQKFVKHDEMLYVRDFLLLWCYHVIPPRRSLDFVNMKIKNIDTNDDNYYRITKKEFVFNSYKTAKTYGQDAVPIQNDIQQFNKFYKQWLKINPTEYLLFDNRFNQLTSSKLTKILNRIFGAKVSVNMLRHIYVTDQYNDTSKKSVKEVMSDMHELAADMGHSVSMQKQYYKKE